MSLQYFHAGDGARLAYRDHGEGLPVLALAGLTRDGHDFDYLAHHLPAVRLIRLDCRGRGNSAWTGAATYTVAQEARDALALLDHLDIARAAIIGSSRGGLIGMLLAATDHARLSGLCLNDVGPVLEPAGLDRIAGYVGLRPGIATLAEVADRMPSVMPGFANVTTERWAEETARHFTQLPDGVGLPYDPDLRLAIAPDPSTPSFDGWPLFDACAGLPLALIRGVNSDILGAATADRMAARRPDMIRAEVPDRGHIPFLDEPAALAAIHAWLALVGQTPRS